MSKVEKSESSSALYFIIIGIVIVSVLIGYPAFMKIRENAAIEANRYNGFDFTPEPQGNRTTWKTTVSVQSKLYQLQFYYHPRDLENIPVDPSIGEQIINPKTRPRRVYISLPDSNDGLTLVIAGVELSKILGYQLDLFNIEVKSAMQTAPSNNTQDVSVVDCLQATANATVISFHEAPYNIVIRDEDNPYCVRFGYETARDAIKVADRLSYMLLGVMP